MPKCIRPISISNFPAVRTNCFGFAIGDTESLNSTFFTSIKFNMDGTLPINEAFHKKLRELGYDELPRQISTLDEATSNEYVFMVLASEKYSLQIPFMGERELCWNYHVVRREPDGTWVHKPGWKDSPCEISTEADWEDIYNEFGRKYVLFAVAEK